MRLSSSSAKRVRLLSATASLARPNDKLLQMAFSPLLVHVLAATGPCSREPHIISVCSYVHLRACVVTEVVR